jgi:quinol monooxygenase YgiN
MAICRIVTFRVKPGTAQSFAAAFAPIMEKVRKEPGCEHYELFTSTVSSDTLVMLERWTDQASIAAALKLFPGRDHPSVAFLNDLVGAPVRRTTTPEPPARNSAAVY